MAGLRASARICSADRLSANEMQEDGGDHGQVASGMGHHGAPQGASPQAAESEGRA